MHTMECNSCGKEKPINRYSLTWQKAKKLCNYCCRFYGFNPINATKIAATQIDVRQASPTKKEGRFLVKCLRCDKQFMGKKNNRICGRCKGHSEYSDDTLYANMEVSL